MKPKFRYRVVRSSDYVDFETDVNGFLADGWELHGDLKVIVAQYPLLGDEADGMEIVYFQAMVKPDLPEGDRV